MRAIYPFSHCINIHQPNHWWNIFRCNEWYGKKLQRLLNFDCKKKRLQYCPLEHCYDAVGSGLPWGLWCSLYCNLTIQVQVLYRCCIHMSQKHLLVPDNGAHGQMSFQMKCQMLNGIKLCSNQAKAKIIFDVYRLFCDLYRLFCDLFRFCSRFHLVWMSPKGSSGFVSRWAEVLWV